MAPISSTHSAAASSTALRSTRRDPITGKIYVGEPEPLEELADLVGGLLGGLGRVADGLLGPAPVPIPIPVEDERAGEQAPEQSRTGNADASALIAVTKKPVGHVLLTLVILNRSGTYTS